jgi:lysophospholipase L1-like esterase
MNLVFFGDSICFGEKAGPHRGWVTRISAAIEEKFGPDVLVINSSVNGNTTRMALERMPFDVQRYGCDVLVVQFGLNDCNHWETDRGLPRVSPAAFEHNLLEIAERGRRFGAKRIFFHTNHPTLRTDLVPHAGRSYEDGNVAYNEIVRRAAKVAGVGLVDLEVAFSERITAGTDLSQLLHEDQLHLGRGGHDVYYEAVLPHVTHAVSALRPQ